MHDGLAAPTRMIATPFLVWLSDAVERLSSTCEVCVQGEQRGSRHHEQSLPQVPHHDTPRERHSRAAERRRESSPERRACANGFPLSASLGGNDGAINRDPPRPCDVNLAVAADQANNQ